MFTDGLWEVDSTQGFETARKNLGVLLGGELRRGSPWGLSTGRELVLHVADSGSMCLAPHTVSGVHQEQSLGTTGCSSQIKTKAPVIMEPAPRACGRSTGYVCG